jgi:lipoprotein-releasing system ATP-binding protein
MSDPTQAVASPVLALRGVERTYVTEAGGLTVLRGVDLDVYPGEVVGLIGPSGSGKSSLLHAAGLLEKPNAGLIALDGRDCSKLSERQRTKVRLGDGRLRLPVPPPAARVQRPRERRHAAMIAGKSRKAEARGAATEMLDQLGLAERSNHQPGQMSGGEQQRVAIARALANQPQAAAGRRADRQSRPGQFGGGVPGAVRAGPPARRRGPDRHPQHGTGPLHGPGLRPEGRAPGNADLLEQNQLEAWLELAAERVCRTSGPAGPRPSRARSRRKLSIYRASNTTWVCGLRPSDRPPARPAMLGVIVRALVGAVGRREMICANGRRARPQRLGRRDIGRLETHVGPDPKAFE